jgi:hypothetical protein
MTKDEFDAAAAKLGRRMSDEELTHEAVAALDPVKSARVLLTRAATVPGRMAQTAMATRAIGWLLLNDAESRVEVTTDEEGAWVTAAAAAEEYNRGYANARDEFQNWDKLHEAETTRDVLQVKLDRIRAALARYDHGERAEAFANTVREQVHP